MLIICTTTPHYTHTYMPHENEQWKFNIIKEERTKVYNAQVIRLTGSKQCTAHNNVTFYILTLAWICLLTIVRVGGSSSWRFACLCSIRIDHPPAWLACPFILYSDKFAVKWQIVSDGVLNRKYLIRNEYQITTSHLVVWAKLLFLRTFVNTITKTTDSNNY